MGVVLYEAEDSKLGVGCGVDRSAACVAPRDQADESSLASVEAACKGKGNLECVGHTTTALPSP